MKKEFAALMILAGLLTVPANCSANESVIITGDWALPPFTECVNGVMGGSSINGVKEVLGNSGIAAIPVCSGLWPETLKALEAGKVDVVATMFPGIDRGEYCDLFVSGEIDEIGVFLASDNNLSINRTEDLFGAGVFATTEGDSWGKRINELIKNGKIKVILVPTLRDACNKTMDGNATGVLWSLTSGRLKIRDYNLSQNFRETRALEKQIYCVGISKNSPHLKELSDALFKNGYRRWVPE